MSGLSQEYDSEKPNVVEPKKEVAAEEKSAEDKAFVEDNTKADEVEYSEQEQTAISKGWKPEGVEGKPNVGADEFLRNESFFERIHKLERNNKQLQTSMDEMANQHTKIAELERTKVLDELKAKKKVALAEEDYDAVVDIDERIAETRDEVIQDAPANKAPAVDPAYNEWANRNTWYNETTNPDLYDEATTLGYAYAQRTGKVGSDVFEYVEKTIKRMYPDQFESTTPTRKNSVEGSGKSPRRKAGPKAFTKTDLNDVQRRVMDRYVKNGVMKEQEYIDELVRIGELG